MLAEIKVIREGLKQTKAHPSHMYFPVPPRKTVQGKTKSKPYVMSKQKLSSLTHMGIPT